MSWLEVVLELCDVLCGVVCHDELLCWGMWDVVECVVWQDGRLRRVVCDLCHYWKLCRVESDLIGGVVCHIGSSCTVCPSVWCGMSWSGVVSCSWCRSVWCGMLWWEDVLYFVWRVSMWRLKVVLSCVWRVSICGMSWWDALKVWHCGSCVFFVWSDRLLNMSRLKLVSCGV